MYSFPRREKYLWIAQVRGYNNRQKFVVFSSFCLQNKLKRKKCCLQKIDNFLDFISYNKNNKLLRKTERASRKRMFFWFSNFIYSFRNATVKKSHDLDWKPWKLQFWRKSTIFVPALPSNQNVSDKILHANFIKSCQLSFSKISANSETSAFFVYPAVLDSPVQRLLKPKIYFDLGSP